MTKTQEGYEFLEDIVGEVMKVLEPKVLGLGLTTKKYNGVLGFGNRELLFQ